MNVHERSNQLAALSLSERLSATEAGVLEEHLASCPTCQGERGRLESDHRRLRRLVAPRAVGDEVRVAILAEVGSPSPFNLGQLLLVAALLGLLLAGILATAGQSPLPRALGFGGTWTSTNCAMPDTSDASDPTLDCARWGDGSELTLEIGPGDRHSVAISGPSAPACRGTGAPDPGAVGPGGTFLSVTFDRTECGSIGLGADLIAAFYLEPQGRRIWLDDDGDGWGLFWIRAP